MIGAFDEAGRTPFVDPLTELKFELYGKLCATLHDEVRSNATVPEDSVHPSTIASVNFGYSFGQNP